MCSEIETSVEQEIGLGSFWELDVHTIYVVPKHGLLIFT